MMGLTYAALRLTNLFTKQQVQVNGLVDTGATFMCVTEEIALPLGFDIDEVSQQTVSLADGHQRKVPKFAPIEIAFENRSYVTEAVALGNEPLLGVIPLEALDLVVDSQSSPFKGAKLKAPNSNGKRQSDQARMAHVNSSAVREVLS